MDTVNGITTLVIKWYYWINNNILSYYYSIVNGFAHSQLHIKFLNQIALTCIHDVWHIVIILFHNNCDQALDLLVSISYMHYCTSTLDLSTLLSTRGLTTLWYEISYLEASFALICFQRLSFPYSATRLCSWQNNRCTVGSSTPVLAY